MENDPFSLFIDLINFDQKIFASESKIKNIEKDISNLKNEIVSIQSTLENSKNLWNSAKKEVDQNELPGVLVLVGLQGSGKSTLANKLVSVGWERVNQDDLGTRKACEVRMEKALKEKKKKLLLIVVTLMFNKGKHGLNLQENME